MDKKLSESTAAWGPLAIRLSLGLIFMAHGSQKLFGAFDGKGISGTIASMDALGFVPAVFWGWVLAITEFFGGLAIFVGLLSRVAGALIAITMIVAIVKVHGAGGFFAPQGFEYNLALIGMSLSLTITGPGKLALDQLICKRK
ncbi:MAG: DoxX family protein [Armatimonadetes bacterium]|nr:DoxX family protein [Armatimonadota bacterium]